MSGQMSEMRTAGSRAAVVLGLGVNGYGIVRSLARMGVPVEGVFTSATEFGRLSRYCRRSRLVRRDGGGNGLLSALLELAPGFAQPPVLFATDDEHTLLLARHRGELAGRYLFHWVPADQLARIVSKPAMGDLCQEAGVLAPVTFHPQAGDDLTVAAAKFPFPCLIKPIRSFDTAFPHGMKNVVVDSPETLERFYERHPGLVDTTIWQEIVPGGDDSIFQCTTLVGQSGAIGPVFCARKIHQYPPGYGVMCFGRSEENETVAGEALKLLRHLGYRGLASLEFKHQVRDGRYYFIEMNPRLPWYNALFTDAGVNLPYVAYRDLTDPDGPRPPAATQRDGVYWVSLKEDLGWLVRTRRQERRSGWRWARGLLGARSFAWWAPRDPAPFTRAALHLLRRALGRQ